MWMFVFLGFTQNGYWVLTLCVIQLFLVFTQNGTNPFLSNSISLSLLSLSLCARVLLGVLSSDSQEGGQREKKKEKKTGFLFWVCVYSADSLLSAAAVTTRLFVTAVLELGAKLILQKPITI